MSGIESKHTFDGPLTPTAADCYYLVDEHAFGHDMWGVVTRTTFDAM